MSATILVVEDDPVMSKLASRALEHAGHTVRVARDAESALAALEEDDFELVVMDIFLPDGDGLGICQQIRAAFDVPVLMVSSLESELGEPAVGTELGPQAFLSKPVGPDKLVAKVAELLAS